MSSHLSISRTILHNQGANYVINASCCMYAHMLSTCRLYCCLLLIFDNVHSLGIASLSSRERRRVGYVSHEVTNSGRIWHFNSLHNKFLI